MPVSKMPVCKMPVFKMPVGKNAWSVCWPNACWLNGKNVSQPNVCWPNVSNVCLPNACWPTARRPTAWIICRSNVFRPKGTEPYHFQKALLHFINLFHFHLNGNYYSFFSWCFETLR
jgi:hypothetical protein